MHIITLSISTRRLHSSFLLDRSPVLLKIIAGTSRTDSRLWKQARNRKGTARKGRLPYVSHWVQHGEVGQRPAAFEGVGSNPNDGAGKGQAGQGAAACEGIAPNLSDGVRYDQS